MYEWRAGTASASSSSTAGVPTSARGSFPSVGASDSASGEDTCGCVPECGSRARGSGVGVGRRVARVALYSGSAALFVYALHSEPPRAAVVRALQRLGTLPPDFTDFAGRAKYLTFLNALTELGFYSVAAVYEAHLLRRQLACSSSCRTPASSSCSDQAPGGQAEAEAAAGLQPAPGPGWQPERRRTQGPGQRQESGDWERRLGLALRFVRASVVLPLAFYVPFSFWALYAKDRSLIRPREMDAVVPCWIHQVYHSAILPIALVDALLLGPHVLARGMRNRSYAIFIGVCVAYYAWSRVIYLRTGLWPYAFLNRAGPLGRLAFKVGGFIIASACWLIGAKVLDCGAWLSPKMSQLKLF